MRLSLVVRAAGVRLCAAFLLSSIGAWAVPIFTGMTGGTAYGVADYGAPAALVPTFINNNVYGTNDVMVSPGGGFLTADTANHNNVASFGPVGGAFWSAWTGGNGPSGGVFGSGASAVTPNSVGFRLTDVNANGSGFAAYLISSWQSTYVNVGAGWAGVIGNYLGVAGQFGGIESAGAVSLVTTVQGSLGYFERMELVLGAANIGNYNNVAEGDFWALQNQGTAFGTWRGIAFNRRAAAFAVNEIITVTTTLTAIADPMSMDVIDIAPLDLMALLNQPLTPSDWDVTTMTTATPEPGTVMLLGAGLAGAALFRRRLRVL